MSLFGTELAQRLWEPRARHRNQTEQVVKGGKGLQRQSKGRSGSQGREAWRGTGCSKAGKEFRADGAQS